MRGLPARIVPGDVREVIDRTDERLNDMIERLAVIGDLLSEQNSLIAAQNKLLGARTRR